ncbi:hypothetical protein [Sinomonas flava]|uniref:Uncharacterized protein n=1 Tax=Sinomonas flava TaxID=496857 RepID=A0ABN3BXB0_9MICC
MPKLANLVTQKAVLTAVSAGALVLGGASAAAVAAPDESTVDQPVSARAASETYALDAADEPQAESSESAEAPESEAPEMEAPETEAPETESPEAESSETETPEAEAPETEAPEIEAPETEAPEADAPEAPDAGVPAAQASVVAQQATTAAHAQGEDRYPGSVSDVVLQYVPAASKPAPDSVPQAAAPSAAQPAAKPAAQAHPAGQGASAKHGR